MSSRIPRSLSGITRSRVAIPLVSFLVLLYVVIPNFQGLSASSAILRKAEPIPALMAVAAVIGTYVAAAGVYQCLSLRRLSFKRTLQVQAATAFVNRTLPSGLGSMALLTAYLRSEGYGLSESAAIIAINGTIGVMGHLLLLGSILTIDGAAMVPGNLAMPRTAWLVAAAGIGAGVIVFAISAHIRHKVRRLTNGFIRQLAAYRHAPDRLAIALAASLSLTLGSVFALYLCTVSVGAGVTLWQSFAAFTIGTVVGTVTPTPGGLGGVEAGLVAGLIAFGSDAPVALAAVLLFRFITFWLLLLPGFAAFLRIRQIIRQRA